jgi:hypothetical protein
MCRSCGEAANWLWAADCWRRSRSVIADLLPRYCRIINSQFMRVFVTFGVHLSSCGSIRTRKSSRPERPYTERLSVFKPSNTELPRRSDRKMPPAAIWIPTSAAVSSSRTPEQGRVLALPDSDVITSICLGPLKSFECYPKSRPFEQK